MRNVQRLPAQHATFNRQVAAQMGLLNISLVRSKKLHFSSKLAFIEEILPQLQQKVENTRTN